MLQNLKKQVNKKAKRVGRGISAGQGKTAGRGTKGQNSRTGGGVRPGFEGGQMPLTQRIPKKRGFLSLNKKPVSIDIQKLELLKDSTRVTLEELVKANIVRKSTKSVKIVGNKELTKKLTVTIPTTKKAAEQIVKAGGKIEK